MTVPLSRGAIGELFWSTSDAVALLRDGRIVAWNPAAERLFGVAEDVATGPGFDLAGLFGSDRKNLVDLLEAATGWVRLEAAGDAGVVVEASAWRLAGSDVVVVVFRDLTARLRYEQGLRLLSAFARDLIGTEPAVAQLAERIAVLTTELTGARYGGVLVGAGGDGKPHQVGYDAATGGVVEQLPGCLGPVGEATATGRLVSGPDFLGVPLGAPGELIGEIVAGGRPGRPFDATDERLLADLAAHALVALRWAESAELARAEEQRRRDVTNAARHDIANPLAVVRGYLDMLERRYETMGPDQLAAAFAGLRSAFSRLEDFSSRLLLDERLLHEGVVPQWSTVAVADLLARIEREQELSAGARKVEVVATVADGCPEWVVADASMVREVLDNLVGNAVKYSPSGGAVRVVAGPDGTGGVRFEVTDEGPGIPADEQAHLFERFSRTASSRRDHVPGMGLGLSIVRRLVAAHGGEVGLRSRPGAGSTFWASFPGSPVDQLPGSR